MYPASLVLGCLSASQRKGGVISSLHLRWPTTQGAGPPFIVIYQEPGLLLPGDLGSRTYEPSAPLSGAAAGGLHPTQVLATP